jgi:hypothetical protein
MIKLQISKEKFDIWWKTILLCVLIVAIIFMFLEWKNINREALACKSAPFVWGVEQAKEQGITCMYNCFVNENANAIGNRTIIP